MARSYGRGFRAVQALTGPFTPEPETVPLLLDTLSVSTIIAYSSRKLRSAYASSAFRIRRSSDNAEQDIGFAGNDLDTGSLASFVGANDGLLTTTYDQSASVVNATQVTAARQPTVVSAGSNIVQNGKVCFQTTVAATQYLKFTITQAQPITIAICFKLNSLSNEGVAHFTDGDSTGSARCLFGTKAGDLYQLYSGSVQSGGTLDTSIHTGIAIFNGNNGNLWIDGVNVLVNVVVGTQGLDIQDYGAGFGPSSLDCNYCEYLVFPSVLSAGDMNLIRTSWQTYWGAP